MSDLLTIIINVISPIFLVAALGFVIGKRYAPDTRVLSLLLVYVFVPVLTFNGIRTSALSLGDLARLGGLVLLLCVIMTLLGLAIARWLGWDRRLRGAFVTTMVLVNGANYGVPVNRFAFGPAGEQVAIVYYVLNNLIGNVVGVYYSSGGSARREALLNVLRVPITYAAFAGLVFNLLKIELPTPLARSADIAAQGAIPLMLVLLGLQLAATPVRGRWRPVLIGAGMRLVVSPLIAWGLALALGLQGAVLAAAVVQSGMPNAVLTNALAAEFGSDREYTALMTLFSTLASILTLSVLIHLLG
jgi:predicted permease